MEPRLKYERLSSDLRSVLSDDSASCIAVHYCHACHCML